MLRFSPPKAISLRLYQTDALLYGRTEWKAGKRRLVLYAPTGAGKTVMAARLMLNAANGKHYCLFLVDRVALVNQTSELLDAYGIAHGVIQGMHPRWQPWEHVQVCSIHTLAKHPLPRKPGLILYDECHMNHRATARFIEDNPQATVIGLTATPFTKGMANFWDGMVNAISTRKLIEDGYLVEPKIYVARSPEESEFALGKGEFTDASAATAGIRIVGDVVTEWVKQTQGHFGGPVKTIVFSPTVEHGRELCAAFRAAGYNFQQISYRDRDDEERAKKIAEFRRPDSKIHGLVSCGVLTKGFDVPDVLVGISCKPYRKSLSSHMQEIGRIMRTYPGKNKALWLDHSGNIERFAVEMFDVWEHGPGDLDASAQRDGKARKRDKSIREQLVCPKCSGTLRGTTCTCCGWERPPRSNIHAVPGELREFEQPKFAPRPGLRADCVSDPRGVWNAALAHCVEKCGHDGEDARKWAYAVWRGIYPNSTLPRGWFDSAVVPAAPGALSLIEREVNRFRKSRRAK